MPVAEIAWLLVANQRERLPVRKLRQLLPDFRRIQLVEDFGVEVPDIKIIIVVFLPVKR